MVSAASRAASRQRAGFFLSMHVQHFSVCSEDLKKNNVHKLDAPRLVCTSLLF